MPKATFAERLNEALQARNMTAAELSKRSGASEGLISGYRKGAYSAKQNRLDNFAQILDVSIPWLMGYDVPMGSYDGKQIDKSFPASNLIPIAELHMKKIPLIGTIACGTPILAEENITDYIDAPGHIRADFALMCRGDSMIGANIRSGDIVFIRQQPEVCNGQIAAVLVGDEATLKRFYHSGNTVTLLAENPDVAPLTLSGDELERVRVIGLAVAFLHEMEA